MGIELQLNSLHCPLIRRLFYSRIADIGSMSKIWKLPSVAPCEVVDLAVRAPYCCGDIPMKAICLVSAHKQNKIRAKQETCTMQITELNKEIEQALKSSRDEAVTEELKRARAVVQGHGPGGDLRKLCKQTQPFLLSLMVGKRANVVTLQVLNWDLSRLLRSAWQSFTERHISINATARCS